MYVGQSLDGERVGKGRTARGSNKLQSMSTQANTRGVKNGLVNNSAERGQFRVYTEWRCCLCVNRYACWRDTGLMGGSDPAEVYRSDKPHRVTQT